MTVIAAGRLAEKGSPLVTGLLVAGAAGLTLASWALIGFADLETFPRLLQENGDRDSYSLAGVVASFGYGWTAGHVLAAVAGGCLLIWCVVLGQRGDDARAFTLAIAASLALTPILWQHYLVLLAVPLAIARPRFSALWLVPIVLWMSPRAYAPDGVQLLLPVLVGAVVVAGCLVPARRRRLALRTS